MQTLIDWFQVPSHYTQVAVAATMLIEYFLGKSKVVVPNSTLDLVLHIATGKLREIIAKNGASVPAVVETTKSPE